MILPPQVRAVAVDLLRPPENYQLDMAVLTTYTLDLETLLALPLAVLSYSDDGVNDLLVDPLRLVQGLREAADRIHVFVDESGIAIPNEGRDLFALLESSVHPVRVPNGGVFHPKVWLARFTSDDESMQPLFRLAILSRNLTFDRSWDVALASEGFARGRNIAGNRPLGELVAGLPSFAAKANRPLQTKVAERVRDLAAEARRTAFPAPDGFKSPIAFHAFGLAKRRRPSDGPWPPKIDGSSVLAVAPFASASAIKQIAAYGKDERRRVLISRPEELDQLSQKALAEWGEILVMADTASADSDSDATRLSGLHAKMIAIEHGSQVTWCFGSANLTTAAFTGTNVEIIASISGYRGRGQVTRGIDGFLGAFRDLCEQYCPAAAEEQDEDGEKEAKERRAAEERLEQTKKALIESKSLAIVCQRSGDVWQWRLQGAAALCEGIQVKVWPCSLTEVRARKLELPTSWVLPAGALTAFVAFRLSAEIDCVDDVRLALKLPMKGAPKDRDAQILRSMIDSPASLLRFLRALLGGLDRLEGHSPSDGESQPAFGWGQTLGGEMLLEDMLRAASQDPARLDVVRRLVTDLRKTSEGRTILPDDLYNVWTAIDQTLKE